MQPLSQPASKRIQSIDLLRGLVMIIMALDHTRDLFHREALTGNPLNLSTTTPFLYFTRWITHFCAPTFVFLSGLSIWLQSQRKTKAELSSFLLKRGLWLILIEVTVVTLGITGDIHFGFIVLQTIWAIGTSMFLLGLLIWLPFEVILILGLVIVFGHNAFDYTENHHPETLPAWWNFIHRQTFISLGNGRTLGDFYPFLPWTGLMMLGYCCGKLFSNVQPPRRNTILLWMGISCLIFFAVLRASNLYGDPGHWTPQRNSVFTFLSFMNVQKYPPSLLYMSATIGCGLIFLSMVKNTNSKLAKVIIIYGRVPFFYYILHFYVLHLLSIAMFLSNGHSVAEGMKGAPNKAFKFVMPGEGLSLGGVYLVWILVVVALYPLCKWYDRYKSAHPEKRWLSYL